MKYYAVKKGKNIGIFTTWDECKEQINGFSNAEYKSFKDKQDAINYLGCNNINKRTIKDKIETKNTFVVFIDGSYNKNTNTCGYGLVLTKNEKIYIKDFGQCKAIEFTESQNVYGELMGAKKATEIAIANNIKNIIIAYDYIGIEKWVTGEWKAKKKITQEYVDTMKKYSKHINIKFQKIKAHASVEDGGNKFNELADILAKKAVNF